jgi:leucyl-tRNA synthetase
VGRAIELGLDKKSNPSIFVRSAITGEGIMINSGPYDDMESSEARERIIADLTKKHVGKEQVNYRMRDWLISRQRYWGAPIPMIHCPKDGIVPVPEDQLPVELPDLDSFEPSGDGRSPLANVPEFVNTTCPACGGPAERETDTMDGFACSSWYFLRFADPHNSKEPFSKDRAKFWLPVDDYIGGAEHAVMHLLYARMWTKVMQDAGMIDFGEPFKSLRNQGMILAPDGQKMSKSKGNTIQPDELIDQGYGADSIRIMELFIGPWNQSANWSVEGMGGSFRFLQRIWNLVQEYGEAEKVDGDSEAIRRAVHHAIKRVSEDLSDMGFNTAIAALMELTNELYKLKTNIPIGTSIWKESLETVLKLLAPFAPHMTEELWSQMGHKDSIHTSEWPVYDEQYLVKDSTTIAVQINGKLRGTISVPVGSDEVAATKQATEDDKIAHHLRDKRVVKTIFVPDKLLNFVVE